MSVRHVEGRGKGRRQSAQNSVVSERSVASLNRLGSPRLIEIGAISTQIGKRNAKGAPTGGALRRSYAAVLASDQWRIVECIRRERTLRRVGRDIAGVVARLDDHEDILPV